MRSKMEFHPLSELEAKTSPEVLAKARKLYEQDSLNIKLKELRGKYGIKQSDVSSFSQTAISIYVLLFFVPAKPISRDRVSRGAIR